MDLQHVGECTGCSLVQRWRDFERQPPNRGWSTDAECYTETGGERGRDEAEGWWMAGAVNTIGQSKRGGGDRSSRPAHLQARENEQKALSLWIKGATYQQIAAAGFGIASASGAWRSVSRRWRGFPRQGPIRHACSDPNDGLEPGQR